MAIWKFTRDWNFAEPNRMATTDDLEGFEPGEGGGGGGGAVDSVNGQVGVVVLDADDVGAAQAEHVHPDPPTLVSSVNTQTGDVVLGASDVGAVATGGEVLIIEAMTQAEYDALTPKNPYALYCILPPEA